MEQTDQMLLSNIAIALVDHDAQNTGNRHFVDLTEGNVTFILEEHMLEEGEITPEELNSCRDWEKDSIKTFQEHDLIRIDPIPSWKSFKIMEEFAESCNKTKQSQMLSALNRRHPFSTFRYAVEKAGLLQQWYDFKNAAESDLAKEWLIEHNLQIQNGKIVRK